MRQKKRMKDVLSLWLRRYGKYLLCVAAGFLCFLAAEAADRANATVENGKIFRNACGKGDAVYEFYVDGLSDGSSGAGAGEPVSIQLQVPERKLSGDELAERLPELMEALCSEMRGENPSLDEVRKDLNLVRELPEYGVTISWESERPEIVSEYGSVWMDADAASNAAAGWNQASGNGANGDSVSDQHGTDPISGGSVVCLTATISTGTAAETVQIPVTVYPQRLTRKERLEALLETLIQQDPQSDEILLPEEFEGDSLTYRTSDRSGNPLLILLGVAAAVCLFLKERTDREEAARRREERLAEAYPDLVSGFLILTGAGYSTKAAWKKMTDDFSGNGRLCRKAAGTGDASAAKTNAGKRNPWKAKKTRMNANAYERHPLHEEMSVTLHQMETGMPETRAYAAFGRRCGIRCYIRFASLLESSVNTGGANLKSLLGAEMDDAFRQRTVMARKKGEEASSKLLLPMFGMLGVVMIMVSAPAFLTFLG